MLIVLPCNVMNAKFLSQLLNSRPPSVITQINVDKLFWIVEVQTACHRLFQHMALLVISCNENINARPMVLIAQLFRLPLLFLPY